MQATGNPSLTHEQRQSKVPFFLRKIPISICRTSFSSGKTRPPFAKRVFPWEKPVRHLPSEFFRGKNPSAIRQTSFSVGKTRPPFAKRVFPWEKLVRHSPSEFFRGKNLSAIRQASFSVGKTCPPIAKRVFPWEKFARQLPRLRAGRDAASSRRGRRQMREKARRSNPSTRSPWQSSSSTAHPASRPFRHAAAPGLFPTLPWEPVMHWVVHLERDVCHLGPVIFAALGQRLTATPTIPVRRRFPCRFSHGSWPHSIYSFGCPAVVSPLSSAAWDFAAWSI